MTDCCKCKNYEPCVPVELCFDIRQIDETDLWEIYLSAGNNQIAGEEITRRTRLQASSRINIKEAVRRVASSKSFLKTFDYRTGKFVD